MSGPGVRVPAGALAGYALGALLVCGFLEYREVSAVQQAWDVCRLEWDAGDRFSMMFLLVVRTGVNVAVVGLSTAALARRWFSAPLVVLAAGALVLAGGWAFLAWMGLPLTCPQVEPTWWPDALPFDDLQP